MKKMMITLVFMAGLLCYGLYVTESWIFTFAPSKVDEMTIIYMSSLDRIQLEREQASVVLEELRNAPDYTSVVDLARQREQYPISHKLLGTEGWKQHIFYVFLEHNLVSDDEFQNLKILGEETKNLIAQLKPGLPGQQDLIVPAHVARANGQEVPYTRYVLPVAYSTSDFRVYTSGSWQIDWESQAMIIAAWGEKPSSEYKLKVEKVSISDGWLRIQVSHNAPAPNANPDNAPSAPADAVLVDRSALTNLRGACFVDQDGDVFASQGLGSYPVERKLYQPLDDAVPDTPAEGVGFIATLLRGENPVKTQITFYDNDSDKTPVIKRVVESAHGTFQVYVSYEEGDKRHSTVCITGFGSDWRFRARK